LEASKAYKPPPNYAKYGTNGLFIVNYWSNLTTIISSVVVAKIISLIIEKKEKIKNKRIRWLVDLVGEVVVWNYVISYFLGSTGLAIFYSNLEL
jgi:hypothetical protein